jgi:hypothetical protein
LWKGETTVERYGKRPRNRPRVPLLESPRRKLNIELSLAFDTGIENRTCVGNCFSMMCTNKVKTQQEILDETKAAYSRAVSEV